VDSEKGVILAAKYASGDILRFPFLTQSNLILFKVSVEGGTPQTLELLPGVDLTEKIQLWFADSGAEADVRFMALFDSHGASARSQAGAFSPVLRLQLHFGT